jgi:hypothetical protein
MSARDGRYPIAGVADWRILGIEGFGALNGHIISAKTRRIAPLITSSAAKDESSLFEETVFVARRTAIT